MNVGKLQDIAVSYARNRDIPLTRNQCRVIAAEVLRRMEPGESTTTVYADPTGETAVRNVQRAMDRLVPA